MTEEQLREIEARAEEYVHSRELVAGWYPEDMVSLVAAYRELRALAAELALQLRAMPHDMGCDRDIAVEDGAWRCACGRTTVLAKACTAGLLEVQG